MATSQIAEKKENVNQEFYEELWGENAIAYLQKSAGARWFKGLFISLLNEVDSKKVKSVVDIGCGVGLKASLMSDYFKGATVLGCDFAAPAIKAAQKYHKKKNLSFTTKDITVVNKGEKYDLMTVFDVLEHVEDWKGLIERLSKNNTRYMMLSAPTGRMRPYETKIGHYRNYKLGEIEKFMESQGYRVVKTYNAGFPFYSPILRDLTNIFSKQYAEVPTQKMGILGRVMHEIWYILFQYFSLRHKGDNFMGLFEKIK